MSAVICVLRLCLLHRRANLPKCLRVWICIIAYLLVWQCGHRNITAAGACVITIHISFYLQAIEDDRESIAVMATTKKSSEPNHERFLFLLSTFGSQYPLIVRPYLHGSLYAIRIQWIEWASTRAKHSQRYYFFFIWLLNEWRYIVKKYIKSLPRKKNDRRCDGGKEEAKNVYEHVCCVCWDWYWAMNIRWIIMIMILF